MKVVVICDDVLINNGIVNITEKTVFDIEGITTINIKDLDFNFYYSYVDYANSSKDSNQVLFVFYCLKANSIDSNLFIRALEEGFFHCPVLIYSSEKLNKDYIDYLLGNGVDYVLTPDIKENRVSEIFKKTIEIYNLNNKNKCIQVICSENVVSYDNETECDYNLLNLSATQSYKYDPKIGFVNTDFFDHSSWSCTIDQQVQEIETVQEESCIPDYKEKSLILCDFNKLNISLSIRKKKLIQGLVLGLSNKELAQRSNLSIGTVRNYIHQLSNHFEVSNRTELALMLKEKLSL